MFESLVSAVRPFQFKGKARLLGALISHSGTHVATVSGYKIELDLIDHIQRMVFLGAYERWETMVVRRLLKTGMCFVDVGANIGYFTLLAARRVGLTGKVFAIEPSPYAADRLCRTVTENGIGQVQVERCGLGRRPGEVLLYDPEIGNHTPSMLGDSGRPGHVVPVRTLDECIQDWRVKTIDLLKLDVEGYEPEVFAGAESALSSGQIRAILCEFNAYWLARAGTSSAELYRHLLALGFVDASGITGTPGSTTLESRLLVWGSRQ